MTDRTLSLTYGDAHMLVASKINESTNETRALIPIRVGNKILLADPDQLWFWTDEWQAGEQEVDEYILEGNIETFDTMEDFLRTLRE